MPNLTWTDLAAWGGFLLGIGKLGWDFYVWRRKQARLVIRIKRNVFFPEELPDTPVSTGEITDSAPVPYFLSVLIVNVGELPTTVDRVTVTSDPGRRTWMLGKRSKMDSIVGFGHPAISPYDANRIPCLLRAGETIRLRISQRPLDANPHFYPLYLHVETAESDSPTVVPLPAPYNRSKR